MVLVESDNGFEMENMLIDKNLDALVYFYRFPPK